MKALIDYKTLVNLRISLKALYHLHSLLHIGKDNSALIEVLYERTHMELDNYCFKSHKWTVFEDTSEVYIILIRLLNNKVDFELFFAMFIISIYELEYSVMSIEKSYNDVK